MNRSWKYIKIIMIVLFILVTGVKIGTANDLSLSLTFSTPLNAPPYKWMEKKKWVGIDVDIVREACRRAGIKPVFKDRPWVRMLAEVKQGESDGGFTAFKTSKREEFAHFLMGSPIHFSTYVLFVKKGHEFPYETVQDLFGKKIGISLGFKLRQDFHTAVQNGKIDLEEVNNVNQNIRKLLAGRLDAFLHHKDAALYALKTQEFHGKVVMLPFPFIAARPAYLIISKAANIPHKKKVLEHLNLALSEMQKDGTITRIHDKYLQ